MSNKRLILLNCILVFALAFVAGWALYNVNKQKVIEDKSLAEEKITDECTQEEEALEMGSLGNEVDASSAETKISPNATFIIKKKYKECGHTIQEVAELPVEMVNKTQEEIEQEYKDFKVDSFSTNEIVLLKEEKGFCNQHYIIRAENNILVVYTIDENGKETLYEKTGISTEFLPQTDLINMKDGLKIYGKENLNSTLEDYE